jgi:urea carboxylase-associated protein 2
MTQTTETPATETPATTATSTTAGARAHARDQHGRTADTMRHIPAASAPARLTAGVPAAAKDRLTWAESVAFGRYTALPLARGTRLRLTDTDGDACVHVLLYRAGLLHERLNVADTVKVPWQAYPMAGHPLLSDAGRLMATIVADTSARHDALTGTTTLAGNTARYGAGTAHSSSPAGRELLTLAALKQGLGARDVAPSLSLFKGIQVDPDGSIRFTGSAGAGAAVEILLQMDAVVLLANTAHPLDPRPDFTGTAVDVVAWHAPDDLRRLEDGTLAGPLSPEHRQALNNTEHDFTARNAR